MDVIFVIEFVENVDCVFFFLIYKGEMLLIVNGCFILRVLVVGKIGYGLIIMYNLLIVVKFVFNNY